MPIIRDNALCIRHLDYSETSQVLVFFAHEGGHLRLLAKGAKRSKSKTGGAIDLFDVGELAYIPSGAEQLGTLTEWRQSHYFPHLRRDLSVQHAALYLAEATAQLTEPYDPHRGLYHSWMLVLEALKSAENWRNVLAWGQYRLLREIGLAPQLENCAQCQRGLGAMDHLYFSAGSGGVVCRDCEMSLVDKRRLPSGIHQQLGQLAESRVPDINLPDAPVINKTLDYYLTYHLSRPLRMAAYTI